MTRRTWTAKEKAFLVENRHKNAVELAAILNRTPQQVRMAKKRWKLTRQTPALAECRDRLLDYHAEGLSDSLIAGRLCVSTMTITRWRQRLGLESNGWCDLSRRLQGENTARHNAKKRDGQGHTKKQRERWLRGGENRFRIPVYSYHGFDDEQDALLKAVALFRKRHGRPPTLNEMFRWFKAVGYRQVAKPGKLPQLYGRGGNHD